MLMITSFYVTTIITIFSICIFTNILPITIFMFLTGINIISSYITDDTHICLMDNMFIFIILNYSFTTYKSMRLCFFNTTIKTFSFIIFFIFKSPFSPNMLFFWSSYNRFPIVYIITYIISISLVCTII